VPSSRASAIDFGDKLLAVLQRVRASGKILSVLHMTEYIRCVHSRWLATYIANR
jgi:hypothetical protein